MSARPLGVHILGTHGVPAAYGGFETAAEHVGLYLAARGWEVTVHCQVPGQGPATADEWRGLRRVLIPEKREGWLSTVHFDRKSTAHLVRHRADVDVCLTFGYNTGIFTVAHRVARIPHVINMDGMEWTRSRWGLARQAILLANERCAGVFGNLLIGDHPVISDYLGRHFGWRRVRTVTYGAHPVQDAPVDDIVSLGLRSGHYATLICRPIPENSILEIVTAWSAQERGIPLVVLGDYSTTDPYAAKVRRAASEEIIFLGSIYDQQLVSALRYHCRLYLHGHTVGGTNPSLVEALAAGNPVIAHDNRYNTWVAGRAGRYFSDATDLAGLLNRTLDDRELLSMMSNCARDRHAEEFTWDHIGSQYEQALLEVLDRRTRKDADGHSRRRPRRREQEL